MVELSSEIDLSGNLLIAMPGMEDPRFAQSVVFMCAHSKNGAMGLIVNKPSPDLSVKDLLAHLNIPPSEDASRICVHFGGPVEHGRGFVLHSSDYSSDDSTLQVDHHFGMTATLDILKDIARGHGPSSSLLAMGYAGWGPGQLEGELQNNGWLTCEAAPEIVFSADNGGKWEKALAALGIDPLMLSAEGGRA
ncbi:MAG: YqgE/AlgH family protein [Pseudomonadota bacterium]